MSRLPKTRSPYFNRGTITTVLLAGLLYTYSVTSVRAAKRNAQLHREADGGQVDMRKESLRRHGVIEAVPGTKGFELYRDARRDSGTGKREEAYLNENVARQLGQNISGKEEAGVPRTDVEGGLEGYKGRGAAMRKFNKDGAPIRPDEEINKEGG